VDRVGDRIEWRHEREIVRIEAWGPDSARVRAGLDAIHDDLPSALLPAPSTQVEVSAGRLVNGRLTVVVNKAGLVRFARTADGQELLAEQHRDLDRDRIGQAFQAYDGERLYGLGQQLHGRLDQKGTAVDLAQRNAEVSIPVLLSSRGYGLLWNNPALGRVELGATATRWMADAGRQIDYWITAGESPADILRHYADATGHAPRLPEWAAGFWQSKLRYRTQEELLSVAREHHRRGLPLSVIACDFFHWTRMGEWRFDPAEWPDPAAMVRELDAMDVKLMVSIWPTVNVDTGTFARLREHGQLVSTEDGTPLLTDWPDKGSDNRITAGYYDATNEAARRLLWQDVRENYYRHGVRVWWLDACEPEYPDAGFAQRARYAEGSGPAVGNIYPIRHAQGCYEGMREAGETDVVLLARSAWAGSQRWGVALWSGDIPATFESLAVQIRAGLNVALSGIPWWTTDIGGFHGGRPDDPHYRELVIRWFQYGVFCPLLRLHGNREPRMPFRPESTGGPNEVWSYGEEAYQILREQLALRERLRPYLMDQMRLAHTDGMPPMRPLFVDFPHDESAWRVEDQFMFGPDILVAPIAEHATRRRPVYLPPGTGWLDVWTGADHSGGQVVDADAPLEHIPVYLRTTGAVPGMRRLFSVHLSG
jgi:alpha-D-xyloside xylohydrolase